MDRDSWGRDGGQQGPPGPGPSNPYGAAPSVVPTDRSASPQSGKVVAVVLVVLVALIGAGAAGLWFLGRGASSPVADGPATDPSVRSDPLDDYLVDDGFGDPGGFDDPSLDVPDGELPPGLGYYGYLDHGNAECDGIDTWVYAGEGDGSAVVVCVSDADDSLYMRGDFADWPGAGPAEGDVVTDDGVDVANGIYTVRVDGGFVEFEGAAVWFTSGGDGRQLAEFESFWYDDTVLAP